MMDKEERSFPTDELTLYLYCQDIFILFLGFIIHFTQVNEILPTRDEDYLTWVTSTTHKSSQQITGIL
jgi:hypothetical protein